MKTKMMNIFEQQKMIYLEQQNKALKAALSWLIAKPAGDPAFQTMLELKREKDENFINPLATAHPTHFFETGEA